MTAPELHASLRTKAQRFWTFFQTKAPYLREEELDGQLLDTVADEVEKLGAFGWELGPAPKGDAPRTFVISPDGDPDLLPETVGIVALAPSLPGWSFLPARPRREGLSFFIGDVEVDASKWRFVFLPFPDGGLGLVIEQPGLPTMLNDDEDRAFAAVVCLDGILGEQQRLERIDEIYPVTALSAEERAKGQPLSALEKALQARG